MAITDGKAQFILGNDPAAIQLTEGAAGLPMTITVMDAPEIGVIQISFHGIAGIAEGLKVRWIISAPMVPRKDVIDLQGSLVLMGTTQLTPMLCSFQHLVFQGTGDVAKGL